MAGHLFIVATPIGNMGDISQRAADTLSDVDFIAAEDTRVTRVLLTRLGIRKPMVSYYKHNENYRGERIVARLLEGAACALVTDAGTPGISDPGAVLVAMSTKAGISVTCVPGACAVAAALSLCGFAASSYGFHGFLPRGESGRKALLAAYGGSTELVVLYESPNRILKTVELVGSVDPAAELVLCNDLTKKFERLYRGSPAMVLAELQDNQDHGKGEYALVIKKSKTMSTGANGTEEAFSKENFSIEARLVDLCFKEGITLKEAVKRLSDSGLTGLPKKSIYSAGLNVKNLFEN